MTTITKKEIRLAINDVRGRILMNHSYKRDLVSAVREARNNLEDNENFQEMCYYDRISTEEAMYRNTYEVEEILRKNGFRIWGDVR